MVGGLLLCVLKEHIEFDIVSVGDNSVFSIVKGLFRMVWERVLAIKGSIDPKLCLPED